VGTGSSSGDTRATCSAVTPANIARSSQLSASARRRCSQLRASTATGYRLVARRSASARRDPAGATSCASPCSSGRRGRAGGPTGEFRQLTPVRPLHSRPCDDRTQFVGDQPVRPLQVPACRRSRAHAPRRVWVREIGVTGVTARHGAAGLGFGPAPTESNPDKKTTDR
jgi:hypothetical protein